MNTMDNTVDARGLSCPIPVVMVKKAMAGEPAAVSVLVNNPVAMENVTRFAEHQGYTVVVTEASGDYHLDLKK
ncbi:MAG: sulfurtransferase TusA family protein [Eubacterium aggregans]